MTINARVFDKEYNFPYLFERVCKREPHADPAELLDWLPRNGDVIGAHLLTHGAVLLRGFGITSPSAFSRVADALGWPKFEYVDGNSPRKKLASGIYTSTEYSPKYMISLHNEMSYSSKWPDRLLFGCILAPQAGGETPIADSRVIFKRLSAATLDAFIGKGVKYTRNIHGGRSVGPSWQDTFETSDPAEVEEFVRSIDGVLRWRDDGGVRIEQTRPATAKHPKTGEEVWFNQADQFHPSTLPPDEYNAVISLYQGRLDDLPQNACFGDDTAIPTSMLNEIREVTSKTMLVSPWQSGDLLLVDNMLVSHGRMPFSGPRRVLVSMFVD